MSRQKVERSEPPKTSAVRPPKRRAQRAAHDKRSESAESRAQRAAKRQAQRVSRKSSAASPQRRAPRISRKSSAASRPKDERSESAESRAQRDLMGVIRGEVSALTAVSEIGAYGATPPPVSPQRMSQPAAQAAALGGDILYVSGQRLPYRTGSFALSPTARQISTHIS